LLTTRLSCASSPRTNTRSRRAVSVRCLTLA
jgi:hypothetical protein